jgi:hypothetical protein
MEVIPNLKNDFQELVTKKNKFLGTIKYSLKTGNKAKKSISLSPSIRSNESFSEKEDISVEKTNELIPNSTVKSLEQKPLNFSQKLNENTKDRILKESTMNDKNINLNKDKIIDDLVNKNPFRRIKPAVYKLTIVVMSLSAVIVFYTFCDVFRDWIFDKKCFLNRNENWIISTHSILLFLALVVIRWDIYYCSIGREKGRDITFHLRAFAVLLFSEFGFISRIVFILYPKRGELLKKD